MTQYMFRPNLHWNRITEKVFLVLGKFYGQDRLKKIELAPKSEFESVEIRVPKALVQMFDEISTQTGKSTEVLMRDSLAVAAGEMSRQLNQPAPEESAALAALIDKTTIDN